MSPFDASFIDVGQDMQLHVLRRQGNGPKFVFLHGFGEGSFVWFPFARTLPESADVYLIDLRGHGDSSWHPQQEYATGAYVADILQVFYKLDLNGVILIGHSLGARIAISVASSVPDRLCRLVLVDVGLETNAAARDKIIADFVESTKVFARASDYLDLITTNRPLAEPEILREMSLHALREDAEGQYRSKADPALGHFEEDEDNQDLWASLPKISVKSLLIRGTGSAVLSSKCAARIIATMPSCSLATIGIAGHGVMVDNPAAFSAAVNQFLSNSSAVSD